MPLTPDKQKERDDYLATLPPIPDETAPVVPDASTVEPVPAGGEEKKPFSFMDFPLPTPIGPVNMAKMARHEKPEGLVHDVRNTLLRATGRTAVNVPLGAVDVAANALTYFTSLGSQSKERKYRYVPGSAYPEIIPGNVTPDASAFREGVREHGQEPTRSWRDNWEKTMMNVFPQSDLVGGMQQKVAETEGFANMVKLLANPTDPAARRFLAVNIADSVPMMALSFLPAIWISHLNKAGKIAGGARAIAAAAAGGVAGLQTGLQTYDNFLDKNPGDELGALDAFAKMTIAGTGLNSVGFDFIFKKLPPNVKGRILQHGMAAFMEGGTEALEETLQALSVGDNLAEAIKQGIVAFGPGAAMGMATAGHPDLEDPGLIDTARDAVVGAWHAEPGGEIVVEPAPEIPGLEEEGRFEEAAPPEPAPGEEVTPELIATALNLNYDGPLTEGDKTIAQFFTDPRHGSTLAVKGDRVQYLDVARKRQEIAEPEGFHDEIFELAAPGGVTIPVVKTDLVGTKPQKADRTGLPVPEQGEIFTKVDAQQLYDNLDPENLQYKTEGRAGKAGATTSSTIQTAQEWDADLAGVITAWFDPETNKLRPLNGHNRVAAWKRLKDAGKDVPETLGVRVVRAETAVQARAVGAAQNIADGNGTALDAALFFKQSGLTAQDLVGRGITLTRGVAREGMALANLNPVLFDMVLQKTDEMTSKRAAIIGDTIKDQAGQYEFYDAVRKEEAKNNNKTLPLDQLQAMAEDFEAAQTVAAEEGGQMGLLGDETQKSSWVIRGDIIRQVERKLKREKKLFGLVSRERNAAELTEAGNFINAEKSGEIADEAKVILEVFQNLRTTKGPISDALNEGARRVLEEQADAGQVIEEVYGQIVQAIPEALGGRQGGGAGRVQADVPGDVSPAPADELAGGTETVEPPVILGTKERKNIAINPDKYPEPPADTPLVMEHTTTPQWMERFANEGVDATQTPPDSRLGRLTVDEEGHQRQTRIEDPGLYVAPANSFHGSESVVIVSRAGDVGLTKEAQGLGYKTGVQGLFGSNDAVLQKKIPPEDVAGRKVYSTQKKSWEWIPNPKSPYGAMIEVDSRGNVSMKQEPPPSEGGGQQGLEFGSESGMALMPSKDDIVGLVNALKDLKRYVALQASDMSPAMRKATENREQAIVEALYKLDQRAGLEPPTRRDPNDPNTPPVQTLMDWKNRPSSIRDGGPGVPGMAKVSAWERALMRLKQRGLDFGLPGMDLFSIEAPWRRIGFPEIGFHIKNMFSVQNAVEEQGHDVARAEVTTLRDDGKGDLEADFEQDLQNVPLLAETPEDRAALSEADEARLGPRIDALVGYLEDAQRQYAEHGVKLDFKQNLIGRLENELRNAIEVQDPVAITTLSAALDDAKDMNYVPVLTAWFEDQFQRDPQLAARRLQLLNAKKRKTFKIKHLIEDGIIKAEDVNLVDIYSSYARRMGRDFGLLNILNAATDANLAVGKAQYGEIANEIDPEGTFMDASGLAPIFKNMQVHPMLHSWVREMTTYREGMGLWDKGLALAKGFAFYNPLIMMKNDITQSFWSGALLSTNTGKSIARAWNTMRTKGDEYWEALANGLVSQPFANPWQNAQEMVESIKRTGDSRLGHFLGEFFAPVTMGRPQDIPRSLFFGLQKLYNVSWDIAWTLDRGLRFVTYYHLRQKGFAVRDAAQLAAMYHGDYASVPPNTRKILNRMFFTPTFQIAMAKAQGKMLQDALSTSATILKEGQNLNEIVEVALPNGEVIARRREDAIKFQNAKAAFMLAAGNIATHGLMLGLGFKAVQFGRKYIRPVKDDEDDQTKELTITFSNPNVAVARHAYRIFDNMYGPEIDDGLVGALRAFQGTTHPAYGAGLGVLQNRQINGAPIFLPTDDAPTRTAKRMLYYMRRVIPIWDVVTGNNPYTDKKANKIANEQFGRITSLVLGGMSATKYMRTPASRQFYYASQEIAKQFGRRIKMPDGSYRDPTQEEAAELMRRYEALVEDYYKAREYEDSIVPSGIRSVRPRQVKGRKMTPRKVKPRKLNQPAAQAANQ